MEFSYEYFQSQIRLQFVGYSRSRVEPHALNNGYRPRTFRSGKRRGMNEKIGPNPRALYEKLTQSHPKSSVSGFVSAHRCRSSDRLDRALESIKSTRCGRPPPYVEYSIAVSTRRRKSDKAFEHLKKSTRCWLQQA